MRKFWGKVWELGLPVLSGLGFSLFQRAAFLPSTFQFSKY